MSAAPTGFVQVDVDGLWAVRRCYGRPENDTFAEDPCWQEGVPRLDALFSSAGAPASFFIVGRDLELDAKRRAARKLLHRGFELGNHSMTHRLGMTLGTYAEILSEVRRADRLLRAVGARPVGFRAPGYDVDARVLRAVRQCGYLYDASMLPTYLAPVLRMADAVLARRWDPTKRQFGRFSYGRAPRRPYHPRRHAIRKAMAAPAVGDVLEIPVGVTPGWRMPLTAATLFRLGAGGIRDLFRRMAEKRRPVLLLLHAIDAVDCRRPIVFDSRRPALGGFDFSAERKEAKLRVIVEEFSRAFRVVRAADYAADRFREVEAE